MVIIKFDVLVQVCIRSADRTGEGGMVGLEDGTKAFVVESM